MKKLCITTVLISLTFSLFAYDWPVNSIKPENIKSFFAQKRGTTISSSLLISSEPEKGAEESFIPEVKTIEDGRVLIVISDIEDENSFFPSTLGQAVIVSHPDNILSVYGNLNNKNDNNFYYAEKVSSGTTIGTISNSAWSETKNSVELKILDTKRSLAINPVILLPKLEKEKSFPPTEIIVENKDGKRFDLNNNRTFLSGNYKFYQKRNENLVPMKITLSLNGELSDEISFTEIYQKDNTVYVSGKNKKYTIQNLYPDSKLLLLGETRIAKGKSVITFENYNHNGDKRIANYAVNNY